MNGTTGFRRLFPILGLALAGAVGCRPEAAAPKPTTDRLASLERGLDRQREMEDYLRDVQAWSVKIVANASPEDHDRAEATAADLEAHIHRVAALVQKTRSDRFAGWTPTLAAASRELDDLKDAHYRALSGYPPERRETEREMAADLEELGKSLSDYRVEVSSLAVSDNGEIRRRIAALERGRREAGDILRDITRADSTNWPYLKRRWDRKKGEWQDDQRLALERLRSVPRPAPSPTPAPVSAPAA